MEQKTIDIMTLDKYLKAVKLIANAILEQQEQSGQLCPDTIKALKELI